MRTVTDFHGDLGLTSALFDAGDASAATWHLCRSSAVAWHQLPSEEWSHYTQAIADMGLLSHVHQDPFTAHSFDKPRGYAGDADLLDLIYDYRGANTRAVSTTTEPGRVVNTITWNAPEPRAVRWRRSFAGEMLASLEPGSSRVLSIAAGNCRELEGIDDQDSGLDRFVALDQDEQSLAEAKRSYPGLVEPIAADAASLVRGKYDLGEFDLIYSLGLLDYLSDRGIRNLIRSAAAMSAPGATLLLANFAPGPVSIGYMESAMAWTLIYRTESQLRDLASQAVSGRFHRASTFRDPEGTIVYLRIDFD